MYRRTIALLLAATAAVAGVSAGETLFPYPVPPDSMQLLQARCDYIVSRFWNRCKFDYAMLHPDRYHQAFGDWLGMMPYADADSVHASISALTARFAKKGPEMTQLATIARHWLHDDTAQYRSDELYLPFATAAANCSKVSKADRQLFAADLRRLTSSMTGATVPAVNTITRDGSAATLDDVKAKSLLLFFDRPGDLNCSLARLRFQTDPSVRYLVDTGELTIADLYPGAPDEQWHKHIADLPDSWVCMAVPEAADYFDLRFSPQLYYLNAGHKVLLKDMNPDALLDVLSYAAKVMQSRRNKPAGNE